MAKHAPRTVAVIGAGAAGIAAARVLRGAGAAVTVLEQAHEVGGVGWGEGEPGSGMHVGLQTNLPNQVMDQSNLLGFRSRRLRTAIVMIIMHPIMPACATNGCRHRV